MLKIISPFLLVLIFSSCGSDENPNLIIYDELNEIEFKLQLEIGNDIDFFFGQLRDLIIVSDGTILVSDWDKRTIEQFHSDGTHEATVASAGRGPGELSSFFLLHEGAGDTLIVRHRGMAQQIDYFVREPDTGVYFHDSSIIKEAHGERFIVLIGPISETEYLARTSWSIGLEQIENQEHERYGQTPISIVDSAENILRDSLHIVKEPNNVTLTRGRSIFPLGTPPYLFHDRIRLIEDGRYFIARSESMVIHIYNQNHNLDHSLQLNPSIRPVENTDIEYNLKDVSEEHQNLLIEHIPNHKPVFLDVWVSETNALLHTDSSEKGEQFVVLSLEGEPIGKFYLSEYNDIRYFRDDRIYSLHKDPDIGHSIRIYQVNI